MIMNVNLEFRNAAQVLPKKSNRYLCITSSTLMVLPYSAKHNRFNIYDHFPTGKGAIKVRWWAPLPAGLQNLY